MGGKNKIYFDFLISAIVAVALVGLAASNVINGNTAAAAIAGLAIGASGLDLPPRRKK